MTNFGVRLTANGEYAISKYVQPLIITCAITGAETTKEMNPNLPVTPEEQAMAAAECVAQGASVIHLHARDSKGRPSQNFKDFRASVEAIREACDPKPIIQMSSGGAVGVPMDERIRPIVELRPEMASLNVASMNFGEDVFLNHPLDVKAFAKRMKELNVIPEIEIYDAGHVAIAKGLLKEGLISHPVHYQFVLGVPGGLPGELRNLTFLVDSISVEDTWAVAGIGRYELPLAMASIPIGGHVRVGFEDNIYYVKGVLAKSNAELVARVRRIAKECARPVATPEEARKILGITNPSSV